MANPSLRHTYWLREHQLAFVYLPKVACTSWKLFLAQALHGPLPEGLTYAKVHQPDVLQLPLVAAMDAADQRLFREQLHCGRISLLAMIREPRSRVLSAYLDKIAHRPNPRSIFRTVVRPSIQAFHCLGEEITPSFLQFLQWIHADRHPACRNDHWQPMQQILGIDMADHQAYAQLWRLDQIQQAAALFNQSLGTSVPFPAFDALGPRPPSGSKGRLHAEFQDSEVEAVFHQLYANDIALFASLTQCC